jgi:iron complex outermembrane receptor protein
MRFVDPDIFLDSRFFTSSARGEGEMMMRLGRFFKFEGGLFYMKQSANISAYQSFREQNQAAAYCQVSGSFLKNKLRASGALRKEYSTGYHIPLIYSSGISIIPFKNITINANISENFRLPSFNDRYWVPGGNSELLPENSINYEAGIKYESFFKFLTASLIEFNIYDSYVNNWIEWLQGEYGFWTACNARKVRAKGLGSSFFLDFKREKKGCQLSGNYTYTSSVNLRERFAGDLSNGKMLMYLPRNKASLRFLLYYGAVSAGLSTDFSGERFINPENTRQLPPYKTLSTFIGLKIWDKRKSGVYLSFQIKNLTATEYQIIEFRPMPGRSYLLSIRFSYN